MKKVLKRIFAVTALMVTALTAGIFAGCSYGPSQEDLKRQEGYSCCVTYDANGGTFGSGSTRTYALVKENSLTPAPGYVDSKTQASVKVPTRRNYQLIGEVKSDGDDDKNEEAILTQSWYLAQTDNDGNVIYEGEGKDKTAKLASDTPWDFTKNKVTQDITLVAQWREVFRFVLCLVDVDENNNPVETEIRSYPVDPGATITDKLYEKDDDGQVIRRADCIRVKQKGYTFLDFYLDKDFTIPLETAYKHPGSFEETITTIDPDTNETVTETVMSNEVKVYVKYLKGEYDLISNDNKDEEALTSTSKWYLTEDIDFTGIEWDSLSEFAGEIIGNGFAMKNLTVKSYAFRTDAGEEYKSHTIFGELSGLISNVTFENVTLKVTTRMPGATIPGEQRASFLAEALTEKAMLTNVGVKDCRILFEGSNGYQTAGDGSLWQKAATGSTVSGLTITENGASVTVVKIVKE